MPRDSNGNYTLPSGNPVSAGTVISDTWANPTMADLAAELTDSLSRSGDGGMLVPFLNTDGDETLPGVSWTNEPSTGFYRNAAGDMRATVIGEDVFRFFNDSGTRRAQVTNDGGTAWNEVIYNNYSSAVTLSGGGALTGTWSDLGTVTTVDINGGTIDGAAIGATTPATGAFTTLAATDASTFSGAVVIDADVDDGLSITRAAGNNRILKYETAGVARWALYTDGVAEGGSNAGSDFQIARYDDAGTFLGNSLTVSRSSGIVSTSENLLVGTTSYSNYDGLDRAIVVKGTNPSWIFSGASLDMGAYLASDSIVYYNHTSNQATHVLYANGALEVRPDSTAVNPFHVLEDSGSAGEIALFSKGGYSSQLQHTTGYHQWNLNTAARGYLWQINSTNVFGLSTALHAFLPSGSQEFYIGTGGTTAPSASQKGWAVRNNSNVGQYVVSSTSSTGTFNHYEFYNTNGNVGVISTNGSTTSYVTSSDYRLKNVTGRIQNSGTYIDSLNPVEGTWKADGSPFVGLIAHEAQQVSRTLIATGKKDGAEMQGMDYSSSEIIANLIAEVQNLRGRLSAAGVA